MLAEAEDRRAAIGALVGADPLEGSDAAQSVMTCYAAMVYGAPLPQFTWTWPNEGTVRVESKTRPLDVKLWQATNENARDFRLESVGKVWKSSPVTGSSGAYEATVAKPAKGWMAYFLELTFPGPLGEKGPPYKFTTEVKVVPDVLPFKRPAAATRH